MVYETSYDTGLRPFNHDKTRGKWSSPNDFLFACLGHAFKLDALFIFPSFMFYDLGFYMLIPYFITLGACVVPLVFMQSFLGQFSSTGFISAFRISPIFKGLGYVSLAINLISLTYYAVLGAIPLFFFFHSLRPTIPWSCEGAKSWMKIKENSTSICTYNNETYGNYTELEVPSLEFFNMEISPLGFYNENRTEFRFSWFLMVCMYLIWAMVAIVVIRPIESIGKIIRYSCTTLMATVGVLVLRFVFLSGALDHWYFILDAPFFSIESLFMTPLLSFSSLGPGWGTVMTMASFNKFDTNIFRYSWLLCLAQVGIFTGIAFMSGFMTSFMARLDPENIDFKYVHSQWMELLILPSGITLMELPHFWSLLFFGMIIIGSLNLLIVQLVSVLTSVFDEFEVLRSYKKQITLGSIVCMALTSSFFCSNHGINFFEALTQVSILSQALLNLFLLIIVVWIYGRERFQRDVTFMTDRTYSTWMVNIVRYVAPFFISMVGLIGFGFVLVHAQTIESRVIIYFIPFVALVPWLLIPGYCGFKLYQTSGMLGNRLKRGFRPTDWYPVESADRQKYEEKFNDTEITHNLYTETDE